MTISTRPRAGWRAWTGLAVLALPTLVAAMDISVLFLALPQLSESLKASGIQQLWIMDIYGFVLSGFLVTMGTLGDRIGSRKLLLMGGGAFGVFSGVAAFSTSPEMLITSRALLGVAGATLMPSGFALIRNMFLDDKQRSVAFAVFITCVMGGGTAGLVIGGTLLEYFWWGSCFLVGLPVMALLLLAGPFLLPERHNPDAGRLDLISVGLSLMAVLPIVYGFKEISRNGLHRGPVLVGLAGVVFAVLFARRQLRLNDPLLDLRLFRNRIFSSSLVIMLVGSFLMAGIMLLFVQYLQLVKGLSPLHAGLCMIATSVALVVGVMLAPFIARRVRPGYVIAIGLAVAVIGLAILIQVRTTTALVVALTGAAFTNLGVGPFVTLATELVQGAVPPQKAGSAAAVSQTSGEGGVAFGLATLGGIGVAVYSNQITIPAGLPAGTADAARESIAGAAAAAAPLPTTQGAELFTNAQHAFTTGMNYVAVIVSIMAAALAVVATTMLRDAKRPGEAAGEADTDHGAQKVPCRARKVGSGL
ncbi:MFS transporter [Dactylosporangium salmoneum]|uniref:MFS transporter n=1 Tax=Dactylosporangium salmoneum TaxID=53361 RepID=A0ABP5V0H6_9ACTN